MTRVTPLLVLGAIFTLGISAASLLGAAEARPAADPIKGFWNFSGGVVEVTGGPVTFAGIIRKRTRFGSCTHPVGEVMWRITKSGSGYRGTHAWLNESTCVPGSAGRGRSTWSITETDTGLVLHFCSTNPDNSSDRRCADLTRAKPVKPPTTTTGPTTTQAETGWLEIAVGVQPAGTGPNQFRVCIKALAGSRILCFQVRPGQVLVPTNHGKRVEWPVGRRLQVCEDEVKGIATPGCKRGTIKLGANRVLFVNRQDTTPPSVKAFPRGKTKLVSRAPLVVKVKDDSGRATLHVALFEGGTKVKEKAGKVKATGKKLTLNSPFAADLVGPLYYCVWAEDSAKNRSKGAPESSCAWISLVAPIGKVSNGCGGGNWDVLVWAQNHFGNEHSYQNSNVNPLALEYTVNFKAACDLHDAGYGGDTVWGTINRRTIDFHGWSRPAVDDKFLADMRTLCERAIPARAKVALANCKARGGNVSFGAESLYNFVHEQGWRFFDADLERPGIQNRGPRCQFRPCAG